MVTKKTNVNVRFQNYWNLLRLSAPWVELAIVFNQHGQYIWQSQQRLHKQMEHIATLVKKVQQQAQLSKLSELHQNLGEKEEVQIIHIQDEEIDASLTVAFVSQKIKHKKDSTAKDKTTIRLLNQSLLTEYSLILKNHEKEQELDAVANELTDRYEELNLIYSSDDNIQNLTHGRELLQQIVVNASNFMDIDMAAIILPDKNVTVQYSKPISSSHQFPHLLNSMRSGIYRQLSKIKKSIVVNHQHDSVSAGIFLEMPYKFIVSPLLNPDNDVIGLLTIINRESQEDFTNSDRNLLEVLANKASNIVIHNFDPLTGLENNHSFELIILDTLKKSWKNGSQHAIAQIDIDKMAVINGISGMEAGDKLIKSVAEILSRMVRNSDTVSRLGADKFSILLTDCDLDRAHQLMTKIAKEIYEIPFQWEKEIYEITISVGIAPISSELKSVSSVIGNVESARLAAKERGRNQIQVFQLDDQALLQRKNQIHWVSRIQHALRENRFELYAQLIHPISTSTYLPHFEILLRMKDDEGGVISPDKFLPAAEKFFLMPNIDRWVISNTFQQLFNQQKLTGQPSCEVSINLSGQSFADRGLDDFIIKMFDKYPLSPTLFCFEVTESSAISNFIEAQVFIARMKNLGCRFSLDDFGTGLSSFAYLKDMDVDFLKIDGSFVKEIIEDEVSYSMVSAMNQIGHAMKLKTIAEYVENDAILKSLTTLGIDFAQGYGINIPQPFALQLESLLVQAQENASPPVTD